jgi:hypothetical protein
VSGIVWLRRSVQPSPARTAWGAAIAGTVLLGAVQVVDFAAKPTDPGLFVRPFSAPAHAWTGADTVTRQVRRARACQAGQAYSGTPFVAFVARRRMPGDQPDQFLLSQSPVAAHAREEAEAEPALCP